MADPAAVKALHAFMLTVPIRRPTKPMYFT
jgi:hypothetical protein